MRPLTLSSMLLPVLCGCCCLLLLAAAFSSSSDSEDRIRELRIEVVKLQILSRLKLKELPPPPAQAPDEALSREAVALLLREEEQPEQPRRKQRLLVPSAGDGDACPDTNSSACRTFLFEFGSSLNGSGLDLWVWKSEEAAPRGGLSVSLSLDDEVQVSSYFEVGDAGWNKLQLLEELSLPDNDTVQAEVRIIGRCTEHRGPRRPYLMATLPWAPVRRRRDVGEGVCDSSESCCLRPLRLSFAEIGFHFIVYPEALEANMCVGRCRLDHGTLRTHYERALYTTLEKNATLADTLGECWTPCCKPKRLREVRVIYKDMENLHHDQFIPELSVESCSCS